MRRNSRGIVTLLGIGAYYLYRNREQVGRFLNQRNINLDTLNRNLDRYPKVKDFVNKAKENPRVSSFVSKVSDKMGSKVSSISPNLGGEDSDLKRAI